ncbi:hypothetical protein WMY93_012943 [Mugilogobius chulae]|uniref:Uncharacterized protein n=1 Tax=Mugilogobius chulae TaxID=88201 RepID=A0AAW0P2P2_9GOBI
MGRVGPEDTGLQRWDVWDQRTRACSDGTCGTGGHGPAAMGRVGPEDTGLQRWDVWDQSLEDTGLQRWDVWDRRTRACSDGTCGTRGHGLQRWDVWDQRTRACSDGKRGTRGHGPAAMGRVGPEDTGLQWFWDDSSSVPDSGAASSLEHTSTAA